MEEFGRQYRVRIGKNNSTGRELGKPNESTGRALRCQFSCEVGDSSSSNTGKITLWNLADETLRLLEQEDCLIELSAGYKDDLPTIMGGTLTYFETEQSGSRSANHNRVCGQFYIVPRQHGKPQLFRHHLRG